MRRNKRETCVIYGTLVICSAAGRGTDMRAKIQKQTHLNNFIFIKNSS